MNYSGGWRFYNAVTDDQAKSYQLTEVSQNVNSCETVIGSALCSYTEDVNITLPYSKLQEAAKYGLKLRLTGKSAKNTIVEIPSNVVQGYLNGLQKL